jgi:hypothetical protein
VAYSTDGGVFQRDQQSKVSQLCGALLTSMAGGCVDSLSPASASIHVIDHRRSTVGDADDFVLAIADGEHEIGLSINTKNIK